MSPRTAAFLLLSTALVLSTTPATGDVVFNGTFTMNAVNDSPGEDLLVLLGHENSFSLVFFDESWSCVHDDQLPFCPCMSLLMDASAFEIAFQGPDSLLLNDVVATQLTRGGIEPEAYFAITANYDPGRPFHYLRLFLVPENLEEGVSFLISSSDDEPYFPMGGDGCPSPVPFDAMLNETAISDSRGDNAGSIHAFASSSIQFALPTNASEATSWGSIKGLFR